MSDAARGAVRIEESAKRVRVYLGGELVADSIRPRLVWEGPSYPMYYLPVEDVRTELLTATENTRHSPSRGDAVLFDVKGGTKVAPQAAAQYADSPMEALRSLIRFQWDAMDAWFEEDEQVFIHPRSPYTRVDVLASSRHVKVVINGVTVADSPRPHLLFETGLPTRYYLPLTDVRMDLLQPSSTVSHCPYKGTATYWSIDAGGERFDDVVWTYTSPFPESQKIAGLVAFYNERVDHYVDGELQPRPRTKFSR